MRVRSGMWPYIYIVLLVVYVCMYVCMCTTRVPQFEEPNPESRVKMNVRCNIVSQLRQGCKEKAGWV